jgi:hypothetical protein
MKSYYKQAVSFAFCFFLLFCHIQNELTRVRKINYTSHREVDQTQTG